MDREAKLEKLERETAARVELINAQKRNKELKPEALYAKKKAEYLKVLKIKTKDMDPEDAAIIEAEKIRIRAEYFSKN